MSPSASARYQGHLSLPEVGPAGQRKLAEASVLCIGAGGLGSPALLYLAAAGVGRIGVLDSDKVDISNLQRQVLYRTADIGASKVESAHATLAALNPDITLVTHDLRLDRHNAAALFADYDVILDGTDNFPTRYLINDTCVRLGKPDVWASIYRFEGQLAVFDANQGPCYRCLFPEVPPDGEIPACSEAGVLGVLPGILGTCQALEAIKLIVGIGQSLIGRLLMFDALAMSWQELTFDKDPACRACGPHPQAVLTSDYEAPQGISPAELQARLEADPNQVILDCREASEWEEAHLPGSRSLPLRELTTRLAEIPRGPAVVIVCNRGPKSAHATYTLRRAGFTDVTFLEGGLNAWAGAMGRGILY